jgi:hypothetical protein
MGLTAPVGRQCLIGFKLIFGHKRASDFAKLATNELDKVWYGDFALKY